MARRKQRLLYVQREDGGPRVRRRGKKKETICIRTESRQSWKRRMRRESVKKANGTPALGGLSEKRTYSIISKNIAINIEKRKGREKRS